MKKKECAKNLTFDIPSFLFADFSDIRVDSCTDSVCLSVAGILSASRNLQS